MHLLTCLSISFLALNADRASAFIVKVNKGKYDTHVDMISIHAEINSECFLFPYNNNNSIERKIKNEKLMCKQRERIQLIW